MRKAVFIIILFEIVMKYQAIVEFLKALSTSDQKYFANSELLPTPVSPINIHL